MPTTHSPLRKRKQNRACYHRHDRSTRPKIPAQQTTFAKSAHSQHLPDVRLTSGKLHCRHRRERERKGDPLANARLLPVPKVRLHTMPQHLRWCVCIYIAERETGNFHIAHKPA
jgi:hypothetical protein